MTWSSLPTGGSDRHAARAARRVAVSIGATQRTAKSYPGLIVVLRPYLMDTPPVWLRAGERVDIQIGAGEHAGLLRIVPGARFAVGRTPMNAPGKPVLQLRIPTPALADLGTKLPLAPVKFDHADRWLDLTLPEWARVICPPEPALVKVVRAVAAPPPTGNATPPARGVQLAAAAAEMARRKAGL